MRKVLLAPLAALLASTGAAAAAPPAKPKLVVMIAVDQFSAELWDRYRARFTGGLKRLGQGIAYNQGFQSHAGTETCPGHSTMLTGRHPSGTGIVANEWLDRSTGKNVYCVSVPGEPDPARGPQNLKAETLGDWMKRADLRSRVVTISGKDRAAIMLAGHHPDAAYWWTDGEGFGTSAFAGPATPAVIEPAARFNSDLFARWRQSPPALWPASAPADCAALQKPHIFGTLAENGQIPPDFAKGATDGDFLKSKAFALQFRTSPLFDPTTEAFAEQVIDTMKLGHGAGTDLLGVSFSTTDYIAHRTGNGSAETCVQLHAVDAAIGKLLSKLDSLHVPYVVALTADHGGTDAAERNAEAGVKAKRIDTRPLIAALNTALQAQFGLAAAPFLYADGSELYLRPGTPADEGAKLAEAAVRWLKTQPDVVTAFTRAEIAVVPAPKGSPAGLTLLERFRESFDPERSGDVMIAYQPRASFGTPAKFGDAVAGHGSPWDYDRRVPILFWWRGVTPIAATRAIETVDIAPTLAAIARVPAPPVDGRCLPAVAKRCP